jgi:hypothetical protein
MRLRPMMAAAMVMLARMSTVELLVARMSSPAAEQW